MEPHGRAPGAPHIAWDEAEEPHQGISFSGTEVVHLVVSVAVLSVAFSFGIAGLALWQDGELRSPLDLLPGVLEVLPWAAGIVVSSFVLHELAHKVVAQRRALWAEYRSSYLGLALGLVASAFTGFVLAVPGAVHIYGPATDRDEGVISIVGPLLNLALGFVVFPFAFAATGEPLQVGRAGNILEIVVFINAFLAVFNMLPIPPLDGSKIWRWSKVAYLSVLGLCALLLALYFGQVF